MLGIGLIAGMGLKFGIGTGMSALTFTPTGTHGWHWPLVVVIHPNPATVVGADRRRRDQGRRQCPHSGERAVHVHDSMA